MQNRNFRNSQDFKFQLSLCDQKSAHRLRKMILDLKGEVLYGLKYQSECTHILVDKFLMNEIILAGMAAGEQII